MQQDIAIEVSDVKKKFKSYADKAGSLKERFLRPNSGKHDDVWVLKGISFQVKKGEAIGIIGKNGCGKSTTLKLLTRILYPNEGSVQMKGRVSSLIELGAGFHPDMTGRENIYTNASIFGIKRKEVDKRLNDIIRFSELEEYIDNPVRTYSSGMYMRLAFAVAINVDADILLIDEILAVGDSAFQKKCFEKLKEIKANGTTIVIVSHSMEQMYKICDRLIWLENGLIKKEGIPKFVGEEYLTSMEDKRLERIKQENNERQEEVEKILREEAKKVETEKKERQKKEKEEQEEKEREEKERLLAINRQLKKNKSLQLVSSFCRPDARRNGNGECCIKEIHIKDEFGNEVCEFITGQKYKICIKLDNPEHFQKVVVAVGFTREDGVYCYGNFVKLEDNIHQAQLCGEEITFSFCNGFLAGNYLLDFWVQSPGKFIYDEIIGLQVSKVKEMQTNQRGIFTMQSNWE